MCLYDRIIGKKVIQVRNPIAVRPWQHVLEPLSGYLWLGARLLEAAVNANNPHEANLLTLDCTKTKQLLGWFPSLNVEETFELTALNFAVFSFEISLGYKKVKGSL